MRLEGRCFPCCEQSAGCPKGQADHKHLPSMADTDCVVNIAQCKFEQLVGQDRGCIGKSKEGMVCKHRSQAHCARVENGLSAETAETRMTMDNLYLFSDDDVAEDGKERKDGRKCCLAVDNEEGDVVDFETVGEIAHSGPALVRVGDDDHFVSTVNQFLGICQDARLVAESVAVWQLTEDNW